ncbi:MAG: transglutaminase-like domain-containing protein [archaeon]
MRQKIFFAILFLILLIKPSIAENKDSLFFSDSASYNIILNSKIDIIETGTNPKFDYLNTELSIVLDDSIRQKSIKTKTVPPAEYKDNIFIFTWNDYPGKSVEYSISSEINTYYEFPKVYEKISYPINNVPQNLIIYTQPSEKIDINQKIKLLASTLAEGEDDSYIIVAKLAEWVNKNIKYDLSTVTANANQKASWVLENREGVCDEITNLFIALCRSLGIPARFVSGVAYTNSELFTDEWGLHGWAEVYFPNIGWIPYDVTYGQFGYADVGHIKLRDSIDADKALAKYTWKSYNYDINPGSLDSNVEVLNIGKKAPDRINAKISYYDPSVGFNSYNVLKAKITNPYDYYTASEIRISVPREITIDGDKSRFIALAPKQEKTYYWILKVPGGLNQDYLYTFPIGLMTSLNYTYEGSFLAEKKGVIYDYDTIKELYSSLNSGSSKNINKDYNLSCRAPNKVITNESFELFCTIKNTGNFAINGAKICLENDCKQRDILINQEELINFTYLFDSVGEKSVLLSASAFGIKKSFLNKISSVDKPKIAVEILEYPQNVSYRNIFTIKFLVSKESYSIPSDVDIKLSFGIEKEEWHFDSIESNAPFEINIDAGLLDLNENIFTVNVNYKDEFGNEYNSKENFEVVLNEPNFFEKIQIFITRILNSIFKK